jgi:Secretion system C-terminal sorting domain
MKKQLLFVATFVLGSLSWGQFLPNGSFEEWETLGDPATGTIDEPVDWSTFNFYSLYGLVGGVSESTDAYDGVKAAKIESHIGADVTGDGIEDTISGLLLLGVFDPFTGVTLPAMSSTSRPDSLTGYFKYSTVSGENWLARVLVTRWDDVLDSNITIASSDFIGNEATEFTRFSFPINYLSNDIPDSISVLFSNADISLGLYRGGGSTLIVDKVAFVNESEASIPESNSTLFELFPNPSNGILSINSDLLGEFKVFDIQGKSVFAVEKRTKQNITIDIDFLENGIYFVDYNGSRSKFIIKH